MMKFWWNVVHVVLLCIVGSVSVWRVLHCNVCGLIVLLRGAVSWVGTCWTAGGHWWWHNCNLCHLGHVQRTERRT